MAQVCLSVCGVGFFRESDGQARAAEAACRSTRRRIRVSAEGLPAGSGKDGISVLAAAFGEVVLHHRDGQLGERGGAFLPALAGAVHEGAGAEVEVFEVERAELADAQPGLQR